jgi:hypothetical protein
MLVTRGFAPDTAHHRTPVIYLKKSPLYVQADGNFALKTCATSWTMFLSKKCLHCCNMDQNYLLKVCLLISSDLWRKYTFQRSPKAFWNLLAERNGRRLLKMRASALQDVLQPSQVCRLASVLIP